MNITLKKIASALLALSLIVFCGNTYLAAAEDSYTNNVGFTDKKLPDFSENTTLASSRKTTSRSYGKVKISSYSHCEAVDLWFRSKANGDWHYWKPYILSNIDDKRVHKLKYCDASSSYYATNVSSELRGENADSTEFSLIINRAVSGNVWFN